MIAIQVLKYGGDGFATNEVVKTIDVTGESQKMIDKIIGGLEINMDHDRYFTRQIEL